MEKVVIRLYKNAVGAPLHGGEFEFELRDNRGEKIDSARNDAHGLITLEAEFNSPGMHKYSIKETDAPHGWEIDMKEYPVEFKVSKDPHSGKLDVAVDYPDGLPGFVNRLKGEKCRLVEFPKLTFDKPGNYEFTLKELTPSGDGWTTDDREIKVIVRVTDDGHGHLLATVEYPEGFPEFTNRFKVKPAQFILSACKIAIGAPLPEGKFEFGLYDAHGHLVSKARNQ